jgi:putative tryptophan/tyrosine transport system substrate-binding protein
VVTRRGFVLGMAATLAAPRSIAAQPAGRPPHVSIYTTDPRYRDTIVDVLRERGWVEGRSISFEFDSAEGAESRVSERLAKTATDVLVIGGPGRIRAAMHQATTTIPIVGIGNVSGIWMDLPEIAGKQIQFLREVLPALRRLGIVWDDRIGQLHLAAVQAAPAPWASVCTLPRYTRRRMSMRR